MPGLIVPPIDDEPWPTLGKQVCDWIEEYLIHGPGDLRGQQARLTSEKKALLYRAFEVYPKGHPDAGRRRFRRVAISLRKGVAKTELAAWLAAVELHRDGPVRCDGFDANGNPVGRGVTDPYIPMIAYTEEQSEELAYGALRVILGEGPLAADFDVGYERIMRIDGSGKATPLATAPAARDGARTTFQVCDESHRLVLPKQKQAWRTMLANLPKRRLADPWALEITTAYAPGEESVAEDTHDYARQIDEGKLTDAKLFFFHRQAGDGHDLTTREGIRAAVIEASGGDAAWSDIEGIVDQWQDPKADVSFLERVWLNRPVRSSATAFNVEAWRKLKRLDHRVADGALITLGFDGARVRDSTALVGTEVETGFQFLAGMWEKDPRDDNWEVPIDEVRQVVESLYERYDVWRLYADPPHWDGLVDDWAGKWPDKVVAWWTNRNKPMAHAVRHFYEAIAAGEISHDGNPLLASHIGHAKRKDLHIRDDEDRPLWVIQKERPDSLFKIDGAMAAILSWEARGDAIAAGAHQAEYSIYFLGGPSAAKR